MFNILTYDNIPQEGLNWLPREKFLVGPNCPHPDAILLRSFDLHGVPIAESVLAIGRSGSGVNNIPVDAFSKRGIPVFNAPGANANAVKELAITGMLIAARNLTAAWQFIRELEGDDASLQKAVVRRASGARRGRRQHGRDGLDHGDNTESRNLLCQRHARR